MSSAAHSGCEGLHENGVKILGTSVEAIDACENRYKFSKLCDSLRIDQPEWSEFTTIDEAAQYLHWIEMMEAGWTSANE